MSVKSSKSVFTVLRYLAANPYPATAAEVAKALSLPTTTASRALTTLEAAGYAERYQASAKFVVGKAARTLASGFLAQFPVRNLALPYLQRITLESGLTSSLFIRLGWYAVRIVVVLGQNIAHRSPVGETRYLNQGAPSKVMLACMPEMERIAAMSWAALDTDEARALDALSSQIQRQQFVCESSLREVASFDFAVPLFDCEKRVIAAVAIEGAADSQARILKKASSPSRQIIRDLGEKTRGEPVSSLSHYSHVSPGEIELPLLFSEAN